MFCSASDLYIQWGFIYPGARYLDASVYGGFFLGTDFSYMYIVLSRLTGIPRFRFGQPVLCIKPCLTIILLHLTGGINSTIPHLIQYKINVCQLNFTHFARVRPSFTPESHERFNLEVSGELRATEKQSALDVEETDQSRSKNGRFLK